MQIMSAFISLSTSLYYIIKLVDNSHSISILARYSRHFLSCCKRLLNLSSSPLAKGQFGIEYAGSQISVTCCHMGISIDRIDTALQNDEVRNHVISLRQQHSGCKIIAGCDTIERLKGIPLKFLAFDKVSVLLSDYFRLHSDHIPTTFRIAFGAMFGIHWKCYFDPKRDPSAWKMDRLHAEQEGNRARGR